MQLERATEAVRDGTVDKISVFSNELWGSRVSTAYSNLSKIPDERWAEVLAACRRTPDTPPVESVSEILIGRINHGPKLPTINPAYLGFRNLR